MPTATTPGLPGARVVRTAGFVAAECAFGLGPLGDLLAQLTDAVGGRSATLQNALRGAREQALGELRAAAVRMGGNAVVGVAMSYTEISGQGKAMILVAASGTAVVTVPDEPMLSAATDST